MNIGDVTVGANEAPQPKSEEELLREQLDALEAQRMAKRADREKAGAAARLKQRIKDETALTAAEEKHGHDRIASVPTDEGIVIVHAPEPLRYRKYQSLVTQLLDKPGEGAKLQDAATELVLSCLVYPTKPEFNTLADKFPAMPAHAAVKVGELAAGRTRETAEK